MSKSVIRTLLLKALFILLLMIGGIAGSSPVRAQEVIINQSVQNRTVTQSSLRAIFSMRMRQWPDGSPIKVFVLPTEDPIHVSFSKSVLNTFPYQLKRSWEMLIYSGTGQGPTEVKSPREMLKAVSLTRGAIGYIPKDYLLRGGTSENISIMEVR